MTEPLGLIDKSKTRPVIQVSLTSCALVFLLPSQGPSTSVFACSSGLYGKGLTSSVLMGQQCELSAPQLNVGARPAPTSPTVPLRRCLGKAACGQWCHECVLGDCVRHALSLCTADRTRLPCVFPTHQPFHTDIFGNTGTLVLQPVNVLAFNWLIRVLNT